MTTPRTPLAQAYDAVEDALWIRRNSLAKSATVRDRGVIEELERLRRGLIAKAVARSDTSVLAKLGAAELHAVTSPSNREAAGVAVALDEIRNLREGHG